MEVREKSELEKIINNNKIVVVDFWAEWCGPCRVVKPIIEGLSEELSEVQIITANTGEESLKDLVVEYGVRSIPNVILFKDGKLVDRLVGVKTKEDYIKMVKSVS